MTLDFVLETTWKETVAVYLKILPYNFAAENEKNCKKRVGIDGSGQKLEHVISRT
jgi:hypothetical protein